MTKYTNYILGHLRYWLYYSSLKGLIRSHIYFQINYRLKVMNVPCYANGSCVKCGCMTTALQMITPSCEGLCYPPFTTPQRWDTKSPIIDTHSNPPITWVWDTTTNEYLPYNPEHKLLTQQSKLPIITT